MDGTEPDIHKYFIAITLFNLDIETIKIIFKTLGLMLFLYIFFAHFISTFAIYDFSRLLATILLFKKILLWIQSMYLSISILMLDSQAGQVEGLFSLPEMSFSMIR